MKRIFVVLLSFGLSFNLFAENEWFLTGYKIIDVNCNGVNDGQDYFMNNWKFYLLDDSFNVVDSITTNSNGYFEFSIPIDFNNIPGHPNYYLMEESQNLQFTPYSDTLIYVNVDSLYDVGSDALTWFFFNCPIDTMDTLCPDTCIAPSIDKSIWPPLIIAKESAEEKKLESGKDVIVCFPALIRSGSSSPFLGKGPIPSIPFSLCKVIFFLLSI